MIDTDKYEGHTTDWEWKDKEWGVALCGGDSSAGVCGEICCDTPDGKLAQDAPLLLAEVKQLREELKQTRESLWWCYDNYRFDSHTMVDADWDFIGNLLGADMESEEE